MRKFLSLIILYVLLLPAARAEVLVLVHGYASNAMTWQFSGVSQVLMREGWQPAGSINTNDRVFYTVNLPAKEPMMVQAGILLNQLQFIRQQHPSDQLTLAGHSAGGLVARLAVLHNNPAGVTRLVTIASPHLGTPRAIQGLDIAEDKPFFCPGPGWFAIKEAVGGKSYRYLRDSRGALRDLLPAGYMNLVAWANQQPHPDIEYHAIVRQFGDMLVPAASQDLNAIPALRGRAQLWLSHPWHTLNWQDGEILVRILSGRAHGPR